jgi:hypothetical protein
MGSCCARPAGSQQPRDSFEGSSINPPDNPLVTIPPAAQLPQVQFNQELSDDEIHDVGSTQMLFVASPLPVPQNPLESSSTSGEHIKATGQFSLSSAQFSNGIELDVGREIDDSEAAAQIHIVRANHDGSDAEMLGFSFDGRRNSLDGYLEEHFSRPPVPYMYFRNTALPSQASGSFVESTANSRQPSSVCSTFPVVNLGETIHAEEPLPLRHRGYVARRRKPLLPSHCAFGD